MNTVKSPYSLVAELALGARSLFSQPWVLFLKCGLSLECHPILMSETPKLFDFGCFICQTEFLNFAPGSNNLVINRLAHLSFYDRIFQTYRKL